MSKGIFHGRAETFQVSPIDKTTDENIPQKP